MHRRLTALVLTLLFAASAANAAHLCAGLSGAGPYARCMGHEHEGGTTPEQAMDCCAMAEQSNARGPVKAPVSLTPTATSCVWVVPATEDPALTVTPSAGALLAHRGLPAVPIYLQHLSLLI